MFLSKTTRIYLKPEILAATLPPILNIRYQIREIPAAGMVKALFDPLSADVKVIEKACCPAVTSVSQKAAHVMV